MASKTIHTITVVDSTRSRFSFLFKATPIAARAFVENIGDNNGFVEIIYYEGTSLGNTEGVTGPAR